MPESGGRRQARRRASRPAVSDPALRQAAGIFLRSRGGGGCESGGGSVTQSRLSAPSRPSKNNCYEQSEGAERPESHTDGSGQGDGPAGGESAGPSTAGPVEPSDFSAGLRPLSVEEGTTLRDECLLVETDLGQTVPLTAPNVSPDDGRVKSRPWYRVVRQHTDWYNDYRDSHIEFLDPDGETVRGQLENSYQPQYGDRYYARLMDLRRGLLRRWGDFTVVMLTLSASTVTEQGRPAPPADHMTAIREGWATARQHLYKAIDGEWCYARVWEPTSSEGDGPEGYGHMHVALFVRDGDVTAGDFEPFLRSFVSNCDPAGWEAHRPDGDAVSITGEDDLEEANAATYISEYIGAYGEELHERPIHERAFLSVTWATNTRRVEFDSTAQDIIKGEEFRRETGLRPEDRGRSQGDSEGREAADSTEPEAEAETDGWSFKHLCTVDGTEPEYYDPGGGGVRTTAVDGHDTARLKDVGPPPD